MLHARLGALRANAAAAFTGWAESGRERVAEDVRSYSSPESERHFQAFVGRYDVRPLLLSVRCRALGLYIEGGKVTKIEEAKDLAAALPRGSFQSATNA